MRAFLFLAAAFFLVPLAEIALSLRAPEYVERAYFVHGGMLSALAGGCWLLAFLLGVLPGFRKRLSADLEQPAAGALRHAGAAAIFLEFAVLLCFLKFCQYRGSQLRMDTAVMVQRAYDTLHGNWFYSSVYGANYFSIHFACAVDLLAPLLLLWRGALPLLFAQSVAIASLGLAMYFLVEGLSASRAAGLAGMLLVYSCPAFSQLCAASLNDGVFLAPFLLWALVFAERGRWTWCVVFAALAATTREHFPFSLAGLGIYWIFRRGRPTRDSLIAGGALAAGAVLLWLAEMKVIGSFPAAQAAAGAGDFWRSYFSQYGFTGTGHDAFLFFLLRHPLTTLAKTVSPPERVVPALSLIFYAGLFPLAAPLPLIAFGVALVPQLLAADGPYHDMALHYPSLVLGLLLFAAAHGLARVHAALKKRGAQGWLLAPVLLVCGLGFRNSANPLLTGFKTEMFAFTPDLPALIPPDAGLWADELLAAWVPARARLKVIGGGFDRPSFSRELFAPDFVLMQIGWLVDQKNLDAIAPVLLYLADRGYVRAGEAPGVLLLRSPGAPPPGGAAVLPIPTEEQLAALRHLAAVFWSSRGGPAPAPLKLSAEQRRLESYWGPIVGVTPGR